MLGNDIFLQNTYSPSTFWLLFDNFLTTSDGFQFKWPMDLRQIAAGIKRWQVFETFKIPQEWMTTLNIPRQFPCFDRPVQVDAKKLSKTVQGISKFNQNLSQMATVRVVGVRSTVTSNVEALRVISTCPASEKVFATLKRSISNCITGR